MNPLLPRWFFMADAEARVMPDGRLYLYGSSDVSGSPDYCSRSYRVFSTDDPELETWTDHGVSFRNEADCPGIPYSPDTVLYAPDAVYRDGKYYLYLCGSNNLEAMASADRPEGPFGEAAPVVGADGTGIDPAVLVDDDGSVYYFWGQFRLRGGKLLPDMRTLDPRTVKEDVLTEPEHGFHEGASIRKIGGKYYMVYTDISRGKATCLSYAVSDAPLGPYKKGGVIVDNSYCDPKTWNNHGSIQCFRGRYFVFYHRSSQNSNTSRRVCAEPITILPDGSIPEVPMTSSGAGKPLDAFRETDASVACRMKGNLYIAPDGAGRERLTCCGGGNWMEDWAEYRYLDFGAGVSRVFFRAKGKGSVTFVGDGFRKLGTVEFETDEPAEFSGDLDQSVSGVGSLWILFRSRDAELYGFRFA